MTNFTHTPGPWRLTGGHPSSRSVETVPADGRKPKASGSARAYGCTEEEGRANACLLSAAAEMHAVLWAVRDCPEAAAALARTPMPDGSGETIWKALHRAVIAAATGIPVAREPAPTSEETKA